MDFSTYSGLKSAIADWLDRTDLTSRMGGYVQLGEGRINRLLRTQDQIVVSDITISSATEALPAAWVQTSNLAFADNPVDSLEYLTPDSFARERRVSWATTGKPRFYTILGRELHFLPAPDTNIDLTHVYWEKVPALSDSNTSNWLLESHPDIYLNASLYFAYRFLRDPDGMNEADADLVRAIADLGIADDRSKVPTTPKMRVKPI